MAILTSRPLSPLPWGRLLAATVGLWLSPVALGLFGLLVFTVTVRSWGGGSEHALTLWAVSYAFLLSPLFSWIGWALALRVVALALSRGWFGWVPSCLIGVAAGEVAGSIVASEVALPFAILSLLALRAVLGRILFL